MKIISPMKRQFTATVYIKKDEQVLLIYHKKLRKWLPPGGHIDPNELPTDAAVREAKEETGLHVMLESQDNLTINEANAVSLARPFLCLLEEIPPHGTEPAHQHIDMVYIGRPIGGEVIHNRDETDGIRWFTREDIHELSPEVDIFNETIQTIEKVLVHG